VVLAFAGLLLMMAWTVLPGGGAIGLALMLAGGAVTLLAMIRHGERALLAGAALALFGIAVLFVVAELVEIIRTFVV
jgi:hypothetical protein